MAYWAPLSRYVDVHRRRPVIRIAKADAGFPEVDFSLDAMEELDDPRAGLPSAYCLLRGETDKARLDEKEDWLAVHSTPVVGFQCLVLGARPIAHGVSPLT